GDRELRATACRPPGRPAANGRGALLRHRVRPARRRRAGRPVPAEGAGYAVGGFLERFARWAPRALGAREAQGSRGRRRAAAALTVACVVLVATGLGFLAYPTWTDIRASRTQHRLAKAFDARRTHRDVAKGTPRVGEPVTR